MQNMLYIYTSCVDKILKQLLKQKKKCKSAIEAYVKNNDSETKCQVFILYCFANC